MSRKQHREFRPAGEALESRQLLTSYYLMNVASGKVLDDPGFSTADGAHIQQFQLNGGANQQWNLNYKGHGNYEIANAYSGKVLDDPGFSTTAGTPVNQFQRNGGAN